MYQYRLSPAAQQDLAEIWDYSCEGWGVDQAEDYLRTFERALERRYHRSPD